MPRFEVLANDVVIGHSDLEGGDPPMGVASGLFFPTPEYSSVQPALLKADGRSTEGMVLSVRVRGGTDIPAQGGVLIEDYSAEIGSGVTAIEVSVLGVPYPLYQQLFPAHVVAYKQQFK